MNEALKEANRALENDEVPIGCVIVSQNQIVGRGYNMVEKMNDVTAHAEIIAITAASQFYQSKYLTTCWIYVTIEPCAMCASAIGWAQMPRLIYGAADTKKGYSNFSEKVLHPKTIVLSSILENECGTLMKSFFKKKRKKF
jgi:tRNA(adenine34) deaminase